MVTRLYNSVYESGGKAPLILTSARGGDEWSPPRPSRSALRGIFLLLELLKRQRGQVDGD